MVWARALVRGVTERAEREEQKLFKLWRGNGYSTIKVQIEGIYVPYIYHTFELSSFKVPVHLHKIFFFEKEPFLKEINQ